MEKTARKEREHKQRRAEILQCAEEVFAAKGFHKATVAEIADASGFAVGTLYQFFEGKEQLFAAMITEKLDMFYGGIREAANKKEDALDKIKEVVESHFSFVENNVNFCTIFVQRESTLLAEGSSALRDRMIYDYLEHISFIETIMSEGIKTRILKGTNQRLMAAALAGMLKSFTFEWLYRRGNRPVEDISGTLIHIFLEGVKSVGA